MTRDEFREHWTEWHAGRLDAATAARMQACRDSDDACRQYDRQMRRMLASLGDLPLPDAMPASPPVVVRQQQRSTWPRQGWLAAAAMVVIAFAAGLLTATMLERDTDADAPLMAEAVDAAPGTAQEIHLAVTSRKARDNVEFVVELPAGVEFDGYPDQRIVRWTGSLAEGRSRLSLPLRLDENVTDGEVIARIRYDDSSGERELRVPLTAQSSEEAA